MTDIDPSADINISRQDGQLTALMPLTGPVSPEWLHRYDALVQANDVPAKISGKPDKAWIMVTLAVSAERAGLEATMDAARHLTAKGEAEDRSAAAAEGAIRAWWARQRL